MLEETVPLIESELLKSIPVPAQPFASFKEDSSKVLFVPYEKFITKSLEKGLISKSLKFGPFCLVYSLA